MNQERIVYKLRAIKSILYHMSEINGTIKDREDALIFMAEELEACIEELEAD